MSEFRFEAVTSNSSRIPSSDSFPPAGLRPYPSAEFDKLFEINHGRRNVVNTEGPSNSIKTGPIPIRKDLKYQEVRNSHESRTRRSFEKVVLKHNPAFALEQALAPYELNNANQTVIYVKKEDNVWMDEAYTSSIFIFFHFFEGVFSIISIVLSAILLNRDVSMRQAYLQYLLSELIITATVSFFFITRTIKHENKIGIFYTSIATALKLVSFVIVTAIIIPFKDCPGLVCSTRKGLSSFVIICMFVWLINLVVILTSIFPRYLNPNYETDDDKNFLEENIPLQECSHYPLKQYYLNDNGEMYELTEEISIDGKRKVIVYMS